MALLRRFVREEEGLETVEYAVFAALVVGGLVAAVGVLSNGIKDGFQSVASKMTVP